MTNQQEKIFANGIRFQGPGPKAPSYVKGKISVKVDDFNQFAQQYAKNGWLNLDLKESKRGVLYLELNTWQKGDAPRDTVGYRRTPQATAEPEPETNAPSDMFF